MGSGLARVVPMGTTLSIASHSHRSSCPQLRREVGGLVVGDDADGAGVTHEDARQAAMMTVHPRPPAHRDMKRAADEIPDQVAVAHDELESIGSARSEEPLPGGV